MTELPNVPAREEDFMPDPNGEGAFLEDIFIPAHKLAELKKFSSQGPVFAYADYSYTPHRFIRWTHDPSSFYIDETDKQLWHKKATSNDLFDVWLAVHAHFHTYDLRRFLNGYANLPVADWILDDPDNRGWAGHLWTTDSPRDFGFVPRVEPIPHDVRVTALKHAEHLNEKFRLSLKPLTFDWIRDQIVTIKDAEDKLPTPFFGERFQVFEGNLSKMLRARARMQRVNLYDGFPRGWLKITHELNFPVKATYPPAFDVPLSRHGPVSDSSLPTNQNLTR